MTLTDLVRSFHNNYRSAEIRQLAASLFLDSEYLLEWLNMTGRSELTNEEIYHLVTGTQWRPR